MGHLPRRVRRKPGSRVIVLGADGMDAALLSRWLKEGSLPNLARLAARGGWRPLQTTNPAESPVAWASFATGLNPGKHGVYDFLQRDPATYGLRVGPLTVRMSADGRGLGASNNRHGATLWSLASSVGKRCRLLRVPGTCPPDPINGRMLSGLGVPDLLGSWGASWLYTTEPGPARQSTARVSLSDGEWGEAVVAGPQGASLPLRLCLGDGRLRIQCAGQEAVLACGEWTPWWTLAFRSPQGIDWHGIARFHLWQLEPYINLYLSPLNIDPRQPCLPLTHPADGALRLAERHGLFCTLGWAEDSSALSEGRLDEHGFLDQVNHVFSQHAEMTLDALVDDWDLFISVFEITDRVQHMFWRQMEAAEQGQSSRYAGVILDAYRRFDHLVGQVLAGLRPEDALIVLSDHGFKPVHRLVHVNSWLRDQGFLTVRADGDQNSGHLQADAAWEQTRAYALGLSKIYINLAGRERQGCVNPGREYEECCQAIARDLMALRDPASGEPVVRQVYRSNRLYSGAHLGMSGDLVLGFQQGYRTSQRTAVGGLSRQVIVPNRQRWSADHCSIDPPLVPGVMFASHPLARDDPSILDLAPTILQLLEVPIPREMDGSPLLA